MAGHRGLVGSAIWRELQRRGFTRLIGRTHAELDLLDTAAVRKFYAREKPEYVLDAAAKVGGILANDQHPAEFLFQNLQIQNNLIHGAYQAGVRKLLFLGSSCIYPRLAAAAAEGGIPADRAAGADQPMVCRRQDRRHQDVPGLSPPVWLRLHQRHAHQHVRAE